MADRTGVTTLKGGAVTLAGEGLTVGEKAPDFSLRDQGLGEVKLSDFAGKTLVLLTVPSVDTAVCDVEIRRFNEEAAGLGDNVNILVVSMDMPFAAKRWCGAAGVENVGTGSDYFDHSFGVNYGVRILETGFLARSVLVVDGEGVLRYQEIVGEVAEEPNYEAALAAVKELG